MKIRIMTDSTCDLSPEYFKQHDVTVLPLRVTLNGNDYRDGIDIAPEDIFRAVDAGSPLPKTSAVNVEDYYEAFTEALKTCDAIIHYAISAEFSSCHVNAVAASEGMPVYCVDSRNLSTGIGLMVCAAVDMVEAGCDDPALIVEKTKAMADKLDVSFVIDRLDYLHKGGRCSTVSMLGANMLHLKPCIEVVDGTMVVGRKYRGQYARCLKQYVEDRLQNIDAIDPKRVAVVHTAVDPQTIAQLVDAVRATGHFEEVLDVTAGSTISSHCGDSTMGLMFLKK